MTIEQPKLWWPSGYGEQPLYRVEVELLKDGAVLDTWNRRIGLRMITVHIEKDAYGECFEHEINGVRIFAMGADYIPEDNILPRVTPERTRELLMQAKNANFNCIRVWGGGYYPGDEFWDICDELGLIVWEDFMFACAVYYLSEEFEENITAEFIDNVKRIRHHACLALWCGNNEMESFVESGLWVSRQQERADYIKMYEYIIRVWFPVVPADEDGGILHGARGQEHLLLCDGETPAQQRRKRQDHELSRADLSVPGLL